MADEHPVIYAVNRIPAWVLGEQVLGEAVVGPEITEPIYRFLQDRCRQTIDRHVATLRALLVRDCELSGRSDPYSLDRLPGTARGRAHPGRAACHRPGWLLDEDHPLWND